MSELDITMATGLVTSNYIKYAEQFIGACNACIRLTAKENEIDVVLIEMSPSASALNRCILMGSDYFIIPTSPDFFCYQAIQSLCTMLPKWEEQFRPYRESKVRNSLPKNPPQILGIISQRYRKSTAKAKDINTTEAYQKWIDKIQRSSCTKLAPELKKCNMVIEESLFKKHISTESPYNLISISDFNTLIAKAQNFSKSVYALNEDEISEAGFVLKQMTESKEKFDELFTQLAQSVCDLIGLKNSQQKEI